MEERYGVLIEGMYSGKDRVPMEAEIKYRDGRVRKMTTELNIRAVE